MLKSTIPLFLAWLLTLGFLTDSIAAVGKSPILPSGYDQLFPLYVMDCAGSQVRRNNEKAGGKFGHNVIFLKGACRDKTVGYPKVKVCEPGSVDLNDPNAGVGIALDKHYENTKFVVVEGQEFLIDGELAADQPLSSEAFDRTVWKFIQSGSADGVRLTEDRLAHKPKWMGEKEWLSRIVVSSSYALNFGRHLTCTVVPITEKQLADAVQYLGDLNAPYVAGEKKYKFSFMGDNCTDLTHNVKAAMGLRTFVATAESPAELAKKLLTNKMSIPLNDILSGAVEASHAKLRTAEEVYLKTSSRQAFDRYDRPGQAPGVLLLELAAHSTQNDMFDTSGGRAKLMDATGSKTRKLKKMLREPAYTDLATNLRTYLGALEQLKGRQRPLEVLAEENAQLSTREFGRFYARYVQWIESEAGSIRRMLDRL